MKIAAIIAEYNPFHEGHGYLIKKVKEDTGADAVVAVMSGDFTQRGEPAVADKFSRAKMALMQGVDLVVQLPGIFVLSDAAGFAAGAVAICRSLGAHILAFGSETGDIGPLRAAAEILAEEDAEFREYLAAALESGLSYPAARSRACEAKMAGAAEILEGSNNILGIEYIRAGILQNADFEYYTTRRIGSGYREETFDEDKIPSALAIRTSLDKDMGNAAEINGLTEKTAQVLDEIKPCVKLELNDFYEIIRSKILLSSADELSGIYGAREGLSNRIRDAVRKAGDVNVLDEIVATKRYTLTRLHRTYLQMLFDLQKEDYERLKKAFTEEGKGYVRILGFNGRGREILAYVREERKASGEKSFPILSNVAKQKEELTDEASEILDFDMKLSDVYNMISSRDLYSFSDLVHMPVIVENN